MTNRLRLVLATLSMAAIGCFATSSPAFEDTSEPSDGLDQALDEVEALLEEDILPEIEDTPSVVEQTDIQPEVESPSGLDVVSTETLLESGNASLQEVRFNYEGKEWMVLLGTPSSSASLPVLLALHGSGARSRSLINIFSEIALEENVILVAPQAQEPERNWMPEDQAFLNILVDYVITENNANANRVYVVGSSRGGFTAQGLTASHSSRYAAVASIIAGLPDFPAVASVGGAVASNAGLEFSLPQELDRPVPLLMLNGTMDTTVPYGIVDPTLARWTAWNGCIGEPATTQFTENTVLDVYDNCEDDVRVEVYSFEGGHNAELLTGEFGLTPQLIWDFLSQYSL